MSHFNRGGVARITLDYVFPHKYEYAQIIEDLNYGFVEFDWGETRETSSLKIGIKDFNNDIRLKIHLSYLELKYSENASTDESCESDFNQTYTLFNYFKTKCRQSKRQAIGYFIYAFVIINMVLLLVMSAAKILRQIWSGSKLIFRRYSK